MHLADSRTGTAVACDTVVVSALEEAFHNSARGAGESDREASFEVAVLLAHHDEPVNHVGA